MIEAFAASELPMDSSLYWTDAGEALIFGYEEMSEPLLAFLQYVLGITWDIEERDRVAA